MYDIKELLEEKQTLRERLEEIDRIISTTKNLVIKRGFEPLHSEIINASNELSIMMSTKVDKVNFKSVLEICVGRLTASSKSALKFLKNWQYSEDDESWLNAEPTLVIAEETEIREQIEEIEEMIENVANSTLKRDLIDHKNRLKDYLLSLSEDDESDEDESDEDESDEDESDEDESDEDESDEDVDQRLVDIVKLTAESGHTRIIIRLQEGIDQVVIDDEKKVFCLGSIALNGGERGWLVKCVKSVCGDDFILG